MHYVVLRDDDTNALTPVECLERLYRPFLDRALPVNLAVIPNVRTDVLTARGEPEGFLFAKNGETRPRVSIAENFALRSYLEANAGYHVVQHGFDHSLYEFESSSDRDLREKLEEGTRLLVTAGFPKPETFVAPYDRFSVAGLREVAARFHVISGGWYELSRLPIPWWPRYTVKTIFHQPHWHVGHTVLLTHPGCLLSCQRPLEHILDQIKAAVSSRRLTVLVTHWWEYFNQGHVNEPFIRVLHQTADWLAREPDVKVISFKDLAQGNFNAS